MSISAPTALHVLRLVWRHPPTWRSFATVVRLKELDEGSSSFFTPDRSSPNEDTDIAPVSNFLEAYPDEYEAVSSSLPSRHLVPVDIPWPTLFPPSEAAPAKRRLSQPHRIRSLVGPREPKHYPDHPLAITKPCDPMARLVLAGDLDGARKVYTQLSELKLPIQDRFIYLPAAISCLEANDCEGFLFWMGLYPNRPATKDHSGLRHTWYPILIRLLREHTLDIELLLDFTYLAAGRGFLPTIFHPIIRHLAHVLPPEESIEVLRQAMRCYRSVTIPSGSDTDRGVFVRDLINKQVNEWWNAYLRALVTAGWKFAAQALYERSDVVWEEFTKNVVTEEIDFDSRTMIEITQATAMRDEVVPHILDIPESLPDDLVKQVQRAVTQQISAAKLAKILQELDLFTGSHPTFLLDFEREFCDNPAEQSTHHTTVYRQKTWWHATMLKQRDKRDFKGVINTFRNQFLWVGLPGTPPTIRESDPVNPSPLYPSIMTITTVLPILIDLLPGPHATTVPALHATYLARASHFPPALRPTSATHLVFVRALVRHIGGQAGAAGIRLIAEAGFDPGEQPCAFVLKSFVSEGNLDAMCDLLDRMDARDPIVDQGTVRFSWPSLEAYQSLVRILAEKGQMEVARAVLERARRRYDLRPQEISEL